MMGIIQCWLLLLGLFSVRVQADGAKENLARRGTAAQSSIFGDLLAHRAIDGGKDISMNSASCAATYLEARPWWRLDLQASYRVSIVVVTYREDCCPDNRKDFEIRFGSSLLDNGNVNPSCAAISSDSVANSVTYSCSERKGQYVNVLLNGFFKALLLCEVEVYESDYFTRSFMKIAFDSTADLTDPSVTDNVLKELKSALALRGITNVTLSWSQTPEKVVIQNQHENDPC